MSLEVTQFYLASSPRYIMNNVATSTSTSCSVSPISPAFILRLVSLARQVTPVSDDDLSIDDNGIPRGIDVQDPVDERAVSLSAEAPILAVLRAQVS